MSEHDLLLPAGSRLLHIGPPKTATTEIQSAFHVTRDQLAKYGVVYAGRRPQAGLPALAVTGSRGPRGMEQQPEKVWISFVKEVAAAGDRRVMISSEYFSNADAQMATRIIRDLGGRRVHVTITLRPLALILPSAWQQSVRTGLRMAYKPWLTHMLEKPPYEHPTPSFWRRHRYDVLVDRWVEIAGPANVTVIMADPADRRLQLRSFEALLGLPDGLLPAGQAPANRSLTAAEIEVIRLMNREFFTGGWSHQMQRRVIRYGIVPAFQKAAPTPTDPPIRTPERALDHVTEIAVKAADHIAATGVHVIGDLANLAWRPEPAGAEEPAEPLLKPDLAMHALIGALLACEVPHDSTVPIGTKLTATTRPAARPKPAASPAALTDRVKRGVKRRVKQRLAQLRG